MLFEKQYILTQTIETETRYRTETRTDTWTDEDGNTHTDTYEVEVPYTYYIMTVTLKNTVFFMWRKKPSPQNSLNCTGPTGTPAEICPCSLVAAHLIPAPPPI